MNNWLPCSWDFPTDISLFLIIPVQIGLNHENLNEFVMQLVVFGCLGCVDRFNTLRPRQMDAISQTTFKFIFLNENVWIPIKISLKFVPKGQIDNIPALV